MKKFWKWRNCQIRDQASGEEIEERVLFLNGTVAEESWFDDDVTPALFRQELESGSGSITVWINSPGGDCVAAAQIYNMLMDYKGDVTVKVDGIAASAASVIAMAGTKVLMSPVSMMMIHNPATIAFGDEGDMKKAIAMLSEVKESVMNAYEIKTGMDRGKISRLMDNETWMDAHKAVELGFADGILQRENRQDEEDPDGVEAPVMFSRVAATNSLMDKIAAKCRIEIPGRCDLRDDGKDPAGKPPDKDTTGGSGDRTVGDRSKDTAGDSGEDAAGKPPDRDIVGDSGKDATGKPPDRDIAVSSNKDAAGKTPDKDPSGGTEEEKAGRCVDEIRQRLNFIRKFI